MDFEAEDRALVPDMAEPVLVRAEPDFDIADRVLDKVRAIMEDEVDGARGIAGATGGLPFCGFLCMDLERDRERERERGEGEDLDLLIGVPRGAEESGGAFGVCCEIEAEFFEVLIFECGDCGGLLEGACEILAFEDSSLWVLDTEEGVFAW